MKNLVKDTLLLAGIFMLSLSQISAQSNQQAEEIIQNSLAKISENYSVETQQLDFFYRETIQENNEFVQLAEATGEMAYGAYNTPLHVSKALQAYQVGDYYNTNFIGSRWHNTLTQPEDKAFINAARYSASTFKYDIGQQITGGPLGLTAYDKVKYPSFFFDAAHQKNKSAKLNKKYQFELKGKQNLNGYTVYQIEFSPIKINKNYANFQGTIYVEQNSLALVRFEYAQVAHEAQNTYFADDEEFVHPKHQVTLEYAQNNGQWALSYIQVKDEVKWQNAKTKKEIASYITTSELWVQNVSNAQTESLANTGKLLPNTLQSSLYAVQSSYNAELWKQLENSTNYPKLGENMRKDLEKNSKIALDIQFRMQPKSLASAKQSTR